MTVTQQNIDSYNQSCSSGGTLKKPFDSNVEWSHAVTDYLKNFRCWVIIKKQYPASKECYNWCSRYMGAKYKDWFFYEGGGTTDKKTIIYIKDPKKATMFRLQWNDLIVESLDINGDQ